MNGTSNESPWCVEALAPIRKKNLVWNFLQIISEFWLKFVEVLTFFHWINLRHPSTFQNSDQLELFGRLFFLCLERLKLIFYGRFGTKIRKILSKNISIEIHFYFVLIFKMEKGCVTHTKSCAVGLCCPSAARYPKNSYVKVPSLRQLVLKRLMFNPPNCRIAGWG